MSLPLCDHLSLVAARLAAAAHVLLAVDYDGTLTPLVDDPTQAILAPAIRDLLRVLSRRPRLSVAIVSGRALDDVRALVGIDGLIYVANHGLDVVGPGLRYLDSTAVSKQAPLTRLAKSLAERLRPMAGAAVENKGLTLTVHYRRVAPAQVADVHRLVEHALVKDRHGFRLTHGSNALEIRPPVDWHRGTAVMWVREKFGAPPPLVLCVGDDQGDEDAFQAAQDDITVKVGTATATYAQYHVKSPGTVVAFLRWLDQVYRKGV